MRNDDIGSYDGVGRPFGTEVDDVLGSAESSCRICVAVEESKRVRARTVWMVSVVGDCRRGIRVIPSRGIDIEP